ncbi:MAG: hypothetical protein R3190_04115, partial [Thermoanaerobaculia bacterium]|nr:hypothetical protein [Thermoanaerobaculia bacterium]
MATTTLNSVPSRRHHFHDLVQIEQLVAGFGWHLSYTQLSPDRLELEVFETRIGDCLLVREHFVGPVTAYGHSTPQAYDVMVPRGAGGRIFGQEVTPDRVVVYPPGCEVDAVGTAGAETSHVQVPKERLLEAAARWGVEPAQAPRAIVAAPGLDRVHQFHSALERATTLLEAGA